MHAATHRGEPSSEHSKTEPIFEAVNVKAALVSGVKYWGSPKRPVSGCEVSGAPAVVKR